MTDEAIYALMEAADLTFDDAQDALQRLEANGLTIYKKKVFKNGKRPVASRAVTPEINEAIRAYFTAYPKATQQHIANVFNVNIGRVNEALSERKV